MVWCGVLWCDMVCYGVVWCVMVWYGVVWCCVNPALLTKRMRIFSDYKTAGREVCHLVQPAVWVKMA